MMKQLSDFVANILAHIFGGVSLNDCDWVIKKAKYYRDNYPRFDYSACATMAATDWFCFDKYPHNKAYSGKKFDFLYNTAYNALML